MVDDLVDHQRTPPSHFSSSTTFEHGSAYRAVGGTAAETTAVSRSTQRRSINGDNPGLQPETSASWFVGFVWEPIENFSMGVDYWKIDHNDIIEQPLDGFQLANAATFPGTVVSSSGWPGAAANL